MKLSRTAIAFSSVLLIGAAPPEVAGCEIAGDHRTGERSSNEVDGRKARRLRHAPHIVVADRPKRGIGAAVRWAEAEIKRFGCEPADLRHGHQAAACPTPTKVCNAVAIQRGTERPNDVVIITGHIDSRVTDMMNVTADAPGANDDGSGTAAVIEAARVLSKHKFPGTIVYAALSGEEQGLLGGKILADYAKAQGWNVIANFNNDIIGNSCGSDGVCNDKHGPRLFRRAALAGA